MSNIYISIPFDVAPTFKLHSAQELPQRRRPPSRSHFPVVFSPFSTLDHPPSLHHHHGPDVLLPPFLNPTHMPFPASNPNLQASNLMVYIMVVFSEPRCPSGCPSGCVHVGLDFDVHVVGRIASPLPSPPHHKYRPIILPFPPPPYLPSLRSNPSQAKQKQKHRHKAELFRERKPGGLFSSSSSSFPCLSSTRTDSPTHSRP